MRGMTVKKKVVLDWQLTYILLIIENTMGMPHLKILCILVY
jgi:hypothetical protein